jgi:hypothetical protein
MSKMIEVPDPLYDEVREDAEVHGLSLVGWIASKLPQRSPASSHADPDAPRSMAERLAGRLGRVGSGGGERVAQEHSRIFGDILEEKRRAGHL